VAKEDEGERDLTSAEQSALSAVLEQKFPDVKMEPPGAWLDRRRDDPDQ